MKNSKKIALTLSITFILFITVLILTFVLIKSNIPCVGFYRLSSTQQKSIVDFLESTLQNTDGSPTKYGIINYSNDIPLKDQYKKNPCHILFTDNNIKAKNLSIDIQKKNNITIDKQIYNGMPSTMLKIGDNYCIPILFDHYEVLSKESFVMQYNSMILHAKARKTQTNGTLVFAGNDTNQFFMLISAITESFYGEKAFYNLAKALDSQSPIEDIFNTKIKDNITVANVFDNIINLKKQGILHSECFNMTEKDLINFIEKTTINMAFLPLSTHRKINYKTLSNYNSYFFPTNQKTISKSLIAPALVAIPLKNKKFSFEYTTQNILTKLTTPEVQFFLSQKTGLSPSSARAKTADKQASDARLWIASSSAALPNVTSLMTKSQEKIKELEESIKNYIRIHDKHM